MDAGSGTSKLPADGRNDNVCIAIGTACATSSRTVVHAKNAKARHPALIAKMAKRKVEVDAADASLNKEASDLLAGTVAVNAPVYAKQA